MTTAVSRGINWLLRLDHPSDTSEHGLRQHYGKTVDALEMIDALEVLRIMFNDVRRVEGPMYRGEKEFDFVHDIKKAIEGYFLASDDMKEGALLRRKYRQMVQLMLNPLVNSLHSLSHEEAMEVYDELIDEAINEILEFDQDATPDDVFLVQHMISREVARRNRVQATVDGILRLRRRKRRRKNK